MINMPYKFCYEFTFISKSDIDILEKFYCYLNQIIDFICFDHSQEISASNL